MVYIHPTASSASSASSSKSQHHARTYHPFPTHPPSASQSSLSKAPTKGPNSNTTTNAVTCPASSRSGKRSTRTMIQASITRFWLTPARSARLCGLLRALCSYSILAATFAMLLGIRIIPRHVVRRLRGFWQIICVKVRGWEHPGS